MSLFTRLFRKAPSSPLTPAKPAEEIEAPVIETAPDRSSAAQRDEELLKAAVQSGDTPAIARLVIEGASTRIRQQAAQAIDDPAWIRQLIKDARGGNDKSVYRILAAKRDAVLAETRRIEHLQAEIAAASGALEKHSQRPYDALFGPTLEQMEIRWKAVAAQAPAQVVQRTREAIDRAREVVAQHLREVALIASRELADANAAAEAQRRRQIEEQAAAAAAAERAAALEARQKAEAEERESVALARRQLGGLIRKAQAALKEGSTGRAAGLRRAIEEKLTGAPPLPAYLTGQIQQLDARLEELKDWKSFTVTPKRVELIEEMESLVGADLEPQTLANRIKSLQDEWRTLSKGAGENLEADWQRFQEAAHKAYQPCREYFEAQALHRQENLRNREALVARLEAFHSGHDWENPDWRTVSIALRESRQSWRRHSPVERSASRPVQQRFDALIGKLQSLLDGEHARNVREKRSLIERAQRLRTADDSRRAVDDVKELQRRWKSIGPVPRDEDHSLWDEFRQECDAVFERRQLESAEFAAALEANRSKALALCADLEGVAELTGPELLARAGNLAGDRAAFEAIGEFPRADSRDLYRRFERAVERCEHSVARQRALDVERGWSELLDAANLVRTYRLALARNEEPAASRAAAESRIESLRQAPKGGIEALRNGLTRGAGPDLAANETALRMLCIRAEILADLPTPPEDQALRRQYQVQRLVQSMGQGIGADEGQLDALTLEWIGVGPTDDAVYAQLLSRFLRCRKHGISVSLSGDGDHINR